MKAFLAAAVLVLAGRDAATAFAPSSIRDAKLAPSHATIAPARHVPLSMVATSSDATDAKDDYTSDDVQTELTSKGLLKRDRYVATNRFAVRPGREAKFEARWANRKSRLATLDGFRYFHLMRRVTLDEDETTQVYDGGDKSDGTNAGNYVSFTIWDKKSHFSAWRNGEAFKEAHGGTSIGAFVSTMINSALVLQGPPRPAFYDGLLSQSVVPDSVPETVDGWRNVEADGKSVLPTECFVACNQFYVPSDNAASFEKRWADRESRLRECDGFVAFNMLRRDGQQKGHGTVPVGEGEPTYVSCTVWRDREAFEGWRAGNNFRAAHGQKKEEGKSEGEEKKEDKAPASPPQWSKPPTPVFYEGTLVITSEEGA